MKNKITEEVRLQCPNCRAVGFRKIPSSLVDEVEGLASVLVPKSAICEHAFQVYLDRDFNVRGYQKVDHAIELADLRERAVDGRQFSSEDLSSLDLLRFNFGPPTVTYMLAAIFRGLKFVLIVKHRFLTDHIHHLASLIFPKEVDVIAVDERQYKDHRRRLRGGLVVEGLRVREDAKVGGEKVADGRDLRVERKISNDFWGEMESGNRENALHLIRGEVSKAFELANKMADMVAKEGLKRKANEKKILMHFERKHKAFLSSQYLAFVMDVAECRFGVGMPSIYKNAGGFF